MSAAEMPPPPPASPPPRPPEPGVDWAQWKARWQRVSSASVKGFHLYASWLVSISWRRFLFLGIALIAVMGLIHDKPPLTWTFTDEVEVPRPRAVKPERSPATVPPAPPAPAASPAPANPPLPIVIDGGQGKGEGLDISIGRDGVHITPKKAGQAASMPSARIDNDGVRIQLPPGSDSDTVREAVAEAKEQIEQSIREARESAAEMKRAADEAKAEAEAAMAELDREEREVMKRRHTTRIGIGDALMQFTIAFVIASAAIKATYKGRIQAEVKAAQATETAEAESLKRQVVEARMAAMQAQIEPHFLFNTLASIDHLIEVDPKRASQMQKNLIALLRASMPTMRETQGDGAGPRGVRDLGRELAVIRPYLEILKVRMEERLVTELAVPDGLLSAEFPPMMVQTLVENAIKHGLEPKPEGGLLRVVAEIVHGKLQVTVADTGLGFGKAATGGTGVGLANIRERLQLLYGPKASLTVSANTPSGTVVTITVPYKTVEGSYA